ncbi:hypothetical protein C2S51_001243 [Perilla frutescens var. frutescens]|nr:hypothetical protein C2S51_001243 [Perilla frutescens var. frutescens]
MYNRVPLSGCNTATREEALVVFSGYERSANNLDCSFFAWLVLYLDESEAMILSSEAYFTITASTIFRQIQAQIQEEFGSGSKWATSAFSSGNNNDQMGGIKRATERLSTSKGKADIGQDYSTLFLTKLTHTRRQQDTDGQGILRGD